jgi:hydroxymethylpyrimidine pyrophosphatase-like HAD family hydrolase
MRYLTLACDYDGTVAHHGSIDAATLAALERLRSSGRSLILVTGRQLADLARVCPHLDLFEWVVAENGGLLYRPATREERPLGEPPPPLFAHTLERRGVTPLSTGRVVVATWEPHESTVLSVIKELGLELQVIFNKGAVMVLPAGMNKATGLKAALSEMGISPHNVVGVGDAENDHAFLRLCECSAAVANALPTVKETADLVTRGHHGAGVAELVDAILTDDLAPVDRALTRHDVLLGTADDGTEVKLPPYRINLLVAGPSGSGKSTAVTSFLERLCDTGYQLCLVDPEGDYSGFANAVVVGSGHAGPEVEDIIQHLDNPDQNLVVNLVGIPLNDRPAFFLALLPHLLELRTRVGRPHWILIDETHHLLPQSLAPSTIPVPHELDRLLLVTVHPEAVSREVLELVDQVIAVGREPEETIRDFCGVVADPVPPIGDTTLEPGQVLLWCRAGGDPIRVTVAPGRTERRRHIRKYAEGELSVDRSFYFRGPEGRMNLRAQNLLIFLQMADGVDDRTRLHHLRRGDYSAWIREQIKDNDLAQTVAETERQNLPPVESRTAIREAIEQRYTLPAGKK